MNCKGTSEDNALKVCSEVGICIFVTARGTSETADEIRKMLTRSFFGGYYSELSSVEVEDINRILKPSLACFMKACTLN